MTTLMPDWLRRRAEVSPAKAALVSGSQTLTYEGLDVAADAVGRRLQARGVGAGDRVALLASNSTEYAVAVWGASRAGAVLVPLNARLAPGEVAGLVEDCDPQLVVVSDGFEPPPGRPVMSLAELVPRLGDHDSPGPAPDIDLSAVHSILYTSGTTGAPKGAMLSWGNLWWNAVASALNLGLREDDRWLACMPLYHVGGLSILLRGVIYGATVEVHEAFDPERVARALTDGVTVASLVPTMLRRVLDARPGGFGSRLRCVLLGGGPVPAAMVEECLARGIPVAPTYGLTEAASQVATLPPAETPRHAGSVGKPLLPVDVRIGGEGGFRERGDVGEVLVRGPTVMLGYHGRPEATAGALRDGWLHTGDFAYLDEDGYLHVVDRRDDLIVSGGENVYPAEVEAALLAHPAVQDAGVFPLPDAKWGHAVAAAVCLRPGSEASPAALTAFCRGRLAGFKVPRVLVFVEELPRTPSGKLLRRELPALLEK